MNANVHPGATSLGGATGSASPASASSSKPGSKPLTLDGVSKRFGHVVALEEMSLDIRAGELVALLGPSGCGKTSTLRLIAGFDYPDSGEIRIDGQDISHLPPNRRGLGMVFQNYSLFPHMSVAENIAYGPRMAGVSKSEIAVQVKRMLEMIQLPEHGNRRIAQLSGGQQQRIALARALITNPSVLLLDEPLGALDKNLREGMQFELRRIQRELGITSVMVTHDQEEALTMSDRVVVMNRGRILQIGTPREVYERPRTRFVAEFLGTANIFQVSVLHRGADVVEVEFEKSKGSATPGPVQKMSVAPGRRRDSRTVVEVAVRPEKMLVRQARAGQIAFQGTILEHVFRGNHHAYQVHVQALNARVVAYQQAASGQNFVLDIGANVTVSFDPVDAVLLDEDLDTVATPQSGGH